MKTRRLPYMVAVPIPSRDRKGKKISTSRRDRATEKIMKAFGRWFGGATAMAWPCMGTWTRADGAGILIDRGQMVVVVMTTRTAYRKEQKKIGRLVEEVGSELDQEAMAVVASNVSDGYLLFPEES